MIVRVRALPQKAPRHMPSPHLVFFQLFFSLSAFRAAAAFSPFAPRFRAFAIITPCHAATAVTTDAAMPPPYFRRQLRRRHADADRCLPTPRQRERQVPLLPGHYCYFHCAFAMPIIGLPLHIDFLPARARRACRDC
jgi:hypothetical protein